MLPIVFFASIDGLIYTYYSIFPLLKVGMKNTLIEKCK